MVEFCGNDAPTAPSASGRVSRAQGSGDVAAELDATGWPEAAVDEDAPAGFEQAESTAALATRQAAEQNMFM